MSYKRSSLVALALLLVAHHLAFADSQVRERDKAERIKEVLKGKTLYLRGSAKRNKDRFCASFLRDFKEQRHIEYVEPVVQTDDPEHPAFSRFNHCRDYDPPGGYGLESFHGVALGIGETHFKLYRIDRDDNPRNGLEEILYGEMSFEGRRLAFGANGPPIGGYHTIDTKNCLHVEHISTTVLYDDITEEPQRDQFSALIRYRGKPYVYSVERRGAFYHALTLHPVSLPRPQLSCFADTLAPEKRKLRAKRKPNG
jgi:hypothetical protein